jgi:hypothetical protein
MVGGITATSNSFIVQLQHTTRASETRFNRLPLNLAARLTLVSRRDLVAHRDMLNRQPTTLRQQLRTRRETTSTQQRTRVMIHYPLNQRSLKCNANFRTLTRSTPPTFCGTNASADFST